MRIESIALTDWMAFAGQHSLALPAGPIAVVARYEGDAGRSNWAGKTALLEAIEWALYGVHRKRYEDDVIFHGAGETVVEVDFGDVTVTRRRKRGKATVLTVRNPDVTFSKASAEAEVERFTGMNADDFRATLCFAQGDTEAIVGRTSGERRKVLAQWLDLDAWQRAGTRARAHAGAVATRRTGLEIQSTTLDNTIATIDPDDLIARRDTFVHEHEASRQEVDEIDLELEKLASLEDRMRAKKRLAEIGKLMVETKLKIDLAAHIDLDHFEGVEVTRLTVATEAKRVWTEARSLMTDGFDGTCPVSCEACPVADSVNEKAKRGGDRFKLADAEKREAECAHSRAQEELREARRIWKTSEVARARHKDLATEARSLREKAESVSADGMDPRYRDELRTKKRIASDRATEATSAIAHIDSALERRASLLVEQQLALAQLAELETDSQVNALAVKCLGPGGVAIDIAQSALVDLQTRTNAILAGTGLVISFEWDRETKELAPACGECGYVYRGKKDRDCPACRAERLMKRSDELEILTRDESGVVEDIRVKSGGARAMVASAIRLTASALLRERRQSGLSLAIVDEPFGPLDERNRTQLARTFAGMLSSVGLTQALVVSHDAELLDALPAKILITRKHDRSTVEVLS